MTQPWKADIDVSPQLAARCIESQFPNLAPAQVSLLDEGWDNAAFAVNADYLFRFPRRKVAVPLLTLESALLPWLAPQLPVPVPVPKFLGQPTCEFPHPFTGYRLLPGTTACRANLDSDQRTALATPLARFLSALHSADAGKAKKLGAAGDTAARLDVARQSAPARARVASLAERRMIDADLAARLFDLLADTPANLTVRTDALVHGDLYARHVLVSTNAKRTLAGIIDWGDLHLGDPAMDLALVFTILPEKARGPFWITYGIPDNRTYLLARFRAICGMSGVVHYAAETGETDLLREGLTGFGNITA